MKGSSESESLQFTQTCHLAPHPTWWSSQSMSSQRFAFHHEDEGPNVESIPFGYCNPKGYVHPRAAFQQRSDVAGQEECPPCPGSLSSRFRLCHLAPHRSWWSTEFTLGSRHASAFNHTWRNRWYRCTVTSELLDKATGQDLDVVSVKLLTSFLCDVVWKL